MELFQKIKLAMAYVILNSVCLNDSYSSNIYR